MIDICRSEVLNVLNLLYSKNDSIYYLLSVYFNNFPLHVSSKLTAHH